MKRFIPTVISPHGGSLPRTDRRAKADFIGQHLRAGWCASDAAARYEMWVAGAIDANPELEKPSHEKVASDLFNRLRGKTNE